MARDEKIGRVLLTIDRRVPLCWAAQPNRVALEIRVVLGLPAQPRLRLLPEKFFNLVHPAFGARVVFSSAAFVDGFKFLQQFALA